MSVLTGAMQARPTSNVEFTHSAILTASMGKLHDLKYDSIFSPMYLEP